MTENSEFWTENGIDILSLIPSYYFNVYTDAGMSNAAALVLIFSYEIKIFAEK